MKQQYCKRDRLALFPTRYAAKTQAIISVYDKLLKTRFHIAYSIFLFTALAFFSSAVFSDEKSPDRESIRVIRQYGVFDIETKTLWSLPEEHVPARFSPDGRTMISSFEDRDIVVWDVRTQKMLARIDAPEGTASQGFRPDRIVFSPDSSRFAWNVNSKAKIYSTVDGTLLGESEYRVVAFFPDSNDLLITGFENTCRIDGTKGTIVWQRPFGGIVHIAESSGLGLIVARWVSKFQGENPGDVYCVSLEDGQTLWKTDGYEARFDKEENHAVVLSSFITLMKPDCEARIFDAKTGEQHHRVKGQEIEFVPDGSMLVVKKHNSWNMNQRRILVDIATGERAFDKKGEILFSNSGKYYLKKPMLASAWTAFQESRTGKKVGYFNTKSQSPPKLDTVFSLDDRFYVNESTLFETETGRVVCEFRDPVGEPPRRSFLSFGDRYGAENKLIFMIQRYD